MLFNSYEFIFLFLPVTFYVFFTIGKYCRNYAICWLVMMSFVFYAYWDYRYVPLLFCSILFNYFIGRRVEQHRSRYWLFVGIVFNIGLLGYFKYTDFFLTTISVLVAVDYFDLPHIVLPLGISFFTFTQTAYLIDAYRGKTKNVSFTTYCAFVTIFPHMIAGPILNHREMIPQFTATSAFVINYKNVALGITIFTMGLFKKVVIADRLSPWVEDVFSHTDAVTFLEAWIGALSYTFQLYFDFSGYSEMAIGLGLLFNLKLPVNFNSPYQATSIIDFWRRWHMTLGLWVRDYLYIPLGGNRCGELSKMKNLFLSMLIIGLWHGAGWTFLWWGAMHGIALMVNHQWRRLHITLPKPMNWAMTFLCVSVLWVFFRAGNVSEAWNMIHAMAGMNGVALPYSGAYEYLLSNFHIAHTAWVIHEPLGKTIRTLLIISVALVVMKNPIVYAKRFKANRKWLAFTLLLALITIYKMNTNTEFLYFQF